MLVRTVPVPYLSATKLKVGLDMDEITYVTGLGSLKILQEALHDASPLGAHQAMCSLNCAHYTGTPC